MVVYSRTDNDSQLKTDRQCNICHSNELSVLNELADELGEVGSSCFFQRLWCLHVYRLGRCAKTGLFQLSSHCGQHTVEGGIELHTYMSGFSVSHSISSSTVISGFNSATDDSEPHTVQSGFFWCSNVYV